MSKTSCITHPERQQTLPSIIALYDDEQGIMLCDQMGRILTHDQVRYLISAVQNYYFNVSPIEITKQNTLPLPMRRSPPKPNTSEHPGYIYLILAEKTGLYKIGMSTNPSERLIQLQRTCPDTLYLTQTMWTSDMIKDEAVLHTEYSDKLVNGEWFALTEDDVHTIWMNREVVSSEK